MQIATEPHLLGDGHGLTFTNPVHSLDAEDVMVNTLAFGLSAVRDKHSILCTPLSSQVPLRPGANGLPTHFELVTEENLCSFLHSQEQKFRHLEPTGCYSEDHCT